jgi:alpha-beta hydrolase superfamily lysophospholipase
MAPVINDVWFLDDVHHGASVDLNAGKLARTYAWADCARDTLNFVKHVLPTATDGYQMQWTDGATPAPVVGVGHSIGGNAMVQACRAAPGCFSALLLLEPMVRLSQS